MNVPFTERKEFIFNYHQIMTYKSGDKFSDTSLRFIDPTGATIL